MTDRLYARISLDTAASGSIGKQTSTLRKYAGEDFVEYVDRSVSGSKIALRDRPEGARLLADLRPGDRILATKIDRVARNVRDLLEIVEYVDRCGASIRFTEQDVNTEGPMGKFLLTLLGAVAEFEAGLISERRRESLEAFRAEGRHAVGKAPFGLVSVPNPSGRGLVLRPDPETAPALRDAVDRILAGEAQRDVAADLGLGETHLSRLLRNDRLAGVVSVGADGPRIDPAQAVLDLPTWSRLQAHLSRSTKAWSKADGIGAALRCSVCQERLYLNRAKKETESVYKCRATSPKHAETGLGRASITAHRVEAYVAQEFLATFGDLPETYVEETESDSTKAEALALARFQVEAAKAALGDAETDEDEEAALLALRAAKKALRDAEALPVSRVSVVRNTGRTMGEAWEAAETGEERAALLLHFGAWEVRPGRLPIEEKVRLIEDQEAAA